jgi:sec-independent protein translocase protein TatC
VKLTPVRHEDRLTVVEHLDELRNRILVCVGAFAVAFAVCFWQNDLIFDIYNRPLDGKEPLTFGVTEPFLTTMTVAAYTALVIAMPVLLYQIYAFVLPAFTPRERRVALPLLILIPVLFVGGVVFGYYVVLEKAIDFLLGFNSDQFNTEIRARDYYGFVSLALIAMGLLFQIPVAVLALTRVGIVTTAQLRKNRGYAILVIAVLAALLPTVDPVTMLIEMIPLVVLFELSILLARVFEHSSREEQDEPDVPPEGS